MTDEEWRKSVEWVGIVAGCLLKQDGKYLLVQENQKKAFGLWNLPAGHVDRGETIEQAAIRETKEESGYIVELDKEIGLFHESVGRPVKHIFRARVIGGEMDLPANEISDAKWLTYDDIRKLHDEGKLRAEWIWSVVQEVEKISS